MKNTFPGGMQSTQLSESINADLKDYIKSTLDIIQFLKHFERVVRDKRANELKAEFEARNKLPRNLFPNTPLMKRAGEVYTPLIFGLVQNEYTCIGSCYIKGKDESNSLHKYDVGIHGSDVELRKFETFGILCRHALKIFERLDITLIPEAYVLSRWTHVARSMTVEAIKGIQIEENVNLDFTKHYRILCPKLVKITSQVSNSAEGYALVSSVASDLCKQLDNLQIGNPIPTRDESIEEYNVNIAKGLKKKERKKKEGSKTNERWKPWMETQGHQPKPAPKKKPRKAMRSQGSSTMINLVTPCNISQRSFEHSIPPVYSSQATTSQLLHVQVNVDQFASQSSLPSVPAASTGDLESCDYEYIDIMIQDDKGGFGRLIVDKITKGVQED
ncbi:protein FAR1-RELATED SEQUENCE 1-like [Telopea speciosissima]|uniref:protein FAR1-RELATED SEQUENCE 1-like n=1 Tax=Telopea speciosissima TaxID=54955 RepID=UPI001CC3916F|nr:protein FAR1-RELATED SEQUENCE 1-like [Telopea speciosissima]